jgi:multicomponent Na+:H+ antiporter subunit D
MPPVVVVLVGAALLAVSPRRLRTPVLLLTPVVALAAVLRLDVGTAVTVPFYGYELVPLRVDRLSLAFAYVFAIAAFLSSLYGAQVMSQAERIAATVYAGAALGLVFAGDLLSLFFFWEIKAAASVFLIWARRTPTSGGAGMRYLLVHLAGGTVLLGGILWHLAVTGSLAFTAFDPHPASYLILFGFALAAAIPPLHAWLADAYPEATVAGTVFLSAFTTKAAVYALARGFGGYEVLVWLGVIMALYGVVYAVVENDIRRLLGYHIISQVGYMVAAVGIGTVDAINGATAHAFAHILYKGLLLMGAGAVLHATGRSKLTELGGLARSMPLVLVLYLVGAFSISSVPLFSGFVSKELVVEAAALDGRSVVVHLLKLASVGTFLHTGLKLPYFTWYGPQRNLVPGPLPATMYVAMGLTAAINVAIGLQPSLLYDVLPFPVDYDPYTAAKVVETVQLLTFTGFGFWLLLEKLGGEPTVTLDTDWLYRALPRVAAVGVGAGRAGLETARPLRYVPTLRWSGLPDRLRSALLPMWVLGVVILATFLLLLGAGLRL